MIAVLLDVDECNSSPCQNNGSCLERVNGFECGCMSGYTGEKCESGNVMKVRLVGKQVMNISHLVSYQ